MRLKKPALKFHKSTLEKFLLVKFKINRMKELPQIPVRYSKVIPDFKLDNNGLDIFLPAGITSRIDRGDNYIGLCPGSKHFTKRWPLEYFIELGKSLSGNGFKIVLFGGIDDREICAKVANAIPFSIDLSNDNLLLQTAINMYNCKAIICNDSGLMHLACSVDIPVILIMGSTVKEFGFTPYQNKNLILENNLLSCRPCSHIGRNSCPQKHFKCMLDIRPSNVYENLKSFLSAE
jgi:heptosyltransferase-2